MEILSEKKARIDGLFPLMSMNSVEFKTDPIPQNNPGVQKQPCGRWAMSLPIRLLCSVVEFMRPNEVCRTQLVCKGWKLTDAMFERLWRKRYVPDFESETQDTQEIALKGKDTSFAVRYRRRLHLDRNWRAGRVTSASSVPLPELLLGMTITGDNNLMVAGSAMHFLLLEPDSLKVVGEVSHGQGNLQTLCCSTGKLLFGAFNPGVIRAWTLPNLALTDTIYQGHTAVVKGLTASDDFLISASYDATVRVWEISSGTCLRVLNCGDFVHGVAADWENDTVYSASEAGVIMWRISTGEKLATYNHEKARAILISRPSKAQQLQQQQPVELQASSLKSVFILCYDSTLRQLTMDLKELRRMKLPFNHSLSLPGLVQFRDTIVARAFYTVTIVFVDTQRWICTAQQLPEIQSQTAVPSITGLTAMVPRPMRMLLSSRGSLNSSSLHILQFLPELAH